MKRSYLGSHNGCIALEFKRVELKNELYHVFAFARSTQPLPHAAIPLDPALVHLPAAARTKSAAKMPTKWTSCFEMLDVSGEGLSSWLHDFIFKYKVSTQ